MLNAKETKGTLMHCRYMLILPAPSVYIRLHCVHYCCLGFMYVDMGSRCFNSVLISVLLLFPACQCYGHTDTCYYDEEVAENKTSIDIHGNYEGGGVCENCQHNTAGINCEKCKPGFYRAYGVALDSPYVCRREYICT